MHGNSESYPGSAVVQRLYLWWMNKLVKSTLAKLTRLHSIDELQVILSLGRSNAGQVKVALLSVLPERECVGMAVLCQLLLESMMTLARVLYGNWNRASHKTFRSYRSEELLRVVGADVDLSEGFKNVSEMKGKRQAATDGVG